MQKAHFEMISTGLVAILCLLLVGWPAATEAKGPPGVSNTVHNMSISGPVDPDWGVPGPYVTTNEEGVCIFCHTPHGGSLTGPLWNHSNVAVGFTHYNSASMGVSLGSINRAPNEETLLCMSCHDGTVSVYSLHNYNNSLVGELQNENSGIVSNTATKIVYKFVNNARIGQASGDLSDDHPVSFSYDNVKNSSPLYAAGGSRQTYLKDVVLAENGGMGVRFFSPGNRVECSTCHDPHVDYVSNSDYTPFLIMPNTRSDLCLSCHNK